MARRKKPTKAGKKKFSNRPLAAIGKLSDPAKSAPARPAEPAPNKRLPPDDEARLFAEAVAGARPLPDSNHRPPPCQRPAEPEKSVTQRETEEVMDALRELVAGQSQFSIHQTDEAIEGVAEGLSETTIDRLRRGEFSVQDHLDLHGLSREQARPAVEQFLQRSRQQGKRCVLIIHGRGLGSAEHKPVLKEALVVWLTRRAMRKNVMAFTSARSCDGGTGAVYVLLR